MRMDDETPESTKRPTPSRRPRRSSPKAQEVKDSSATAAKETPKPAKKTARTPRVKKEATPTKTEDKPAVETKPKRRPGRPRKTAPKKETEVEKKPIETPKESESTSTSNIEVVAPNEAEKPAEKVLEIPAISPEVLKAETSNKNVQVAPAKEAPKPEVKPLDTPAVQFQEQHQNSQTPAKENPTVQPQPSSEKPNTVPSTQPLPSKHETSAGPTHKNTFNQNQQQRNRNNQSSFSNNHNSWKKSRVELNNPRTPTTATKTEPAVQGARAQISYNTLKPILTFMISQIENEDYRAGKLSSPVYSLVEQVLALTLNKLNTLFGETAKPAVTASTPAPAEEKDESHTPTSQTLINSLRMKLGEIIETTQYLEFNLALLLMYHSIETDFKALAKANEPLTGPAIDAAFTKGKKVRDSVASYTLGFLINELNQADIVSKSDLDELKDILDTRNYLVHQFYKKEMIEAQVKNLTFLTQKFNYLKKFCNRVTNFNEMLTKRMNDMYVRIKEYIHK